MGHCVPKDETAKSSVEALVAFFESRDIDFSSDGTNMNTGSVGGMIALFEERLDHQCSGPYAFCITLRDLGGTCSSRLLVVPWPQTCFKVLWVRLLVVKFTICQ